MVSSAFFSVGDGLDLEAIANIGGCQVDQPEEFNNLKLFSVAPIGNAKEGEVTFLSNGKYAKNLATSGASACILEEKYKDRAPENMALLFSDNPYASYAKVASALHPFSDISANLPTAYHASPDAKIGTGCTIEQGAVICDGAVIGDNCFIGANSYIGKSVSVGDNSIIYQNVTIKFAVIGQNVTIHPGAAIGQDGFGFATENGRHMRVPQLGIVVIEDGVNIGANSCIDRGSAGNTVIGQGTQIDNLVQIGHNSVIGRGCILCGQVGLAGSTELGQYVALGGQAGTAGHLKVGDMANVAAQGGVMNDVAPKEVVGGSPAMPIRQYHKQTALLRNLLNKRKSDGKS